MTCKQDLWEYLASSPKSIVMYGMGNGADKILHACAEKGITVSDFFASDGFVRGHSFHGRTVRSWSEIKEVYGAENVIVLLSFGTSREDVLENILRIADEAELYAPDVPAFGDGLFDRSFYEAHARELDMAAELLADEQWWRSVTEVTTSEETLTQAADTLSAEVAPNLAITCGEKTVYIFRFQLTATAEEQAAILAEEGHTTLSQDNLLALTAGEIAPEA